MEIDFSAQLGSKVIDIAVRRKTQKQRVLAGECGHNIVVMDPILSSIECRACGDHLNPIEWFISMAEAWGEIRQAQLAELEAAEEKLQQLTQTTCQHCGQVTPIS
jgi:ribosomal protein S27E